MKQGKLTNEQLQEFILNRLDPQNKEVVLGAGVGEDSSALDIGDLCVIATDPITAADANVGKLAIHINANDIVSAGAIPIAALVTLLMPTHSSKKDLDVIARQLNEEARSIGVDIIGGHTEITESVNQPIVSVVMIGRPVVKGKVIKTANMRVGDDIVMTKYAGLEGTAILVEDFKEELTELLTTKDDKEINYVHESLSVLPEGIAAAKFEGVSAVHDITEGGVKGAISEMCEAAHTGARVRFSSIPRLPLTDKICRHFGMDVNGLISSGSLLISVRDGDALVSHLATQNIPATVVGEVIEEGLIDEDRAESFTAPKRDELYLAFEYRKQRDQEER